MAHDYKDVFIEEAREQVDLLNDRLLDIEKDPGNQQFVNDIFRVAHTLKSSAAFMGMSDLSDFCHKVESLFQKIRDKEIELKTDLVDLLFKSLDKIKESVEAFAETSEIIGGFESLNTSIDEYEASKSIVTDTSEAVQIEKDVEQLNSLDQYQWQTVEASRSRGEKLFKATVIFEEDVKMKWVRAELIYVNLERMGRVIASHPLPNEFKTDQLGESLEAILAAKDYDTETIKQQLNIDLIRSVKVLELSDEDLEGLKGDFIEIEDVGETANIDLEGNDEPVRDERPGESIEREMATGVDPVETSISQEVEESSKVEIPSNQKQEAKETDVDSKTLLSKSDTVRVSIRKLDDLLNLVGELAITNSGFDELYERFHELLGNQNIVSEFENKIDQLSNIARNLQEGIMQSRMVPIGTVFSRFSRLVRDLSRNLDKKIQVTFKGEETELDKKIIDVIGDPLIHLIRNSIDHGIESVSERLKAGKKEEGNIVLNAYQSGNYIFVEVSDDGHGLNKEKILKKAIEKGILSQEESSQLSEYEIFNMIFLPGFSTKTKVTSISGRGVGMDVVVNTVKSLKGSVSVKSRMGEGSTFTLSFPLTLAIVQAILIQSGFEIYAIPLSNVVETLKVDRSEIQTVDFQEVIRLREKVIPLLRLNELFQVDSQNGHSRISIVISEADDQQIGIVVDKLLGKREIVIKALSQDLQELEGIAGATILGNGQIALILDTPGLIRQSKEDGTSRNRKKRSINQVLGKQQSELMSLKIEKEKSHEEILREFDLDEESYKIMKEIFKIALATSSNNVKRFLNKDIILAVPDIEVHRFEAVKDVPQFLGDEKMFFAEADLTKGLKGKLVIALDEVGMEKLFKDLVGDESMQSSVGESCIMEICNLLTAGLTNTISRALEIKTYPGPPRFFHQSYESYFSTLFDEHQKAKNKYIWTIDTDIIVDSAVVKGKVYVVPHDQSFLDISAAVQKKKENFMYMV